MQLQGSCCSTLRWLILVSLDVVAAVKRFPWWSIIGGTFGLLGNVLVIVLWTWAVLSTPQYDNVRYIIEAGGAGILTVATFLFAFPFAVVGVVREQRLGLAAIIFVLSISPFPVGFAFLHTLASLRHITLAP
jgi:hypothetical protein